MAVFLLRARGFPIKFLRHLSRFHRSCSCLRKIALPFSELSSAFEYPSRSRDPMRHFRIRGLVELWSCTLFPRLSKVVRFSFSVWQSSSRASRSLSRFVLCELELSASLAVFLADLRQVYRFRRTTPSTLDALHRCFQRTVAMQKRSTTSTRY